MTSESSLLCSLPPLPIPFPFLAVLAPSSLLFSISFSSFPIFMRSIIIGVVWNLLRKMNSGKPQVHLGSLWINTGVLVAAPRIVQPVTLHCSGCLKEQSSVCCMCPLVSLFCVPEETQKTRGRAVVPAKDCDRAGLWRHILSDLCQQLGQLYAGESRPGSPSVH